MKVDKNWALDGNPKSWSLLDEDGRRICVIDKGGLRSAERARTILAAPDLLEALKALRNACIGMVPDCAPMVDAAILKAEGRAEEWQVLEEAMEMEE